MQLITSTMTKPNGEGGSSAYTPPARSSLGQKAEGKLSGGTMNYLTLAFVPADDAEAAQGAFT